MKNRKGLHVFTNDNKIFWKLYNTIIVTIDKNKITLNSGGWKTRHTKNCINDILPNGFILFQKNFNWFVKLPCDKIIEFEDKITLINTKLRI